ncbi:major capsid protein [Burkholderia sp. MS389]|uniref:major capsid protein n=1 Tax=Burkholderia TaxID=32008 RepID=UPI00075A3BDF|nr:MULTISPECIES: major capsid protein [Burkholderia]KVH03039.1 major capsid protein E [Burkholderia anthina]KVX35812.1 major capsid protein E [Burkholderia anthina]OXI76705.1 major capsid protein [Burkholderia sp. AU31280]QRR13716.1 major capsid protein [Burkholderia sp. MS389]
MADIALFQDDAFSLSSLSAAINEQPYVPGRIGTLGLFEEDGITTTTIQIERDGDTLSLVASGQRGAPAAVVAGSKRSMIPFNTVHLPQRAVIMADEIANLRAFGSETELEALQTVVNRRLAKMRRQLDATHEFHRIGAIKGAVLDADGKTVLIDLLKYFGIEQTVIAFELSTATTEIRQKCVEVQDAIEDALGAMTYTGVRVLCGREFWNKLIAAKSVKETYLASVMAAQLRGDARDAFDFGGCTFERYRGRVGDVGYVADDEAHAVPEGVSDLFITRFAPADYVEAVNTTGIPYYAKQELMPFGKGVEVEAQSNPIHLCTRPKALIKLKA